MMERFTGNAEYPEDMLLTGPKAAELVDQGTMLVIVDAVSYTHLDVYKRQV